MLASQLTYTFSSNKLLLHLASHLHYHTLYFLIKNKVNAFIFSISVILFSPVSLSNPFQHFFLIDLHLLDL